MLKQLKNILNICCCLFFLHNFSLAQTQITDSLLLVLKTTKEDTVKVKLLNRIGMRFTTAGNYSEAKKYCDDALNLAEKIKFKKGIAVANSNLGKIYDSRGFYTEACNYFTKALYQFEELKYRDDVADTYNFLGIASKRKSKYKEALDYYKKALNIYIEIPDKDGMARLYNNLGTLKRNMGDYVESLEYHYKSLKIKEELGDKSDIGTSYNNIAIIYDDQKNYSLALDFYFKALQIRLEINDKPGIASTYTNIGALYWVKKEYVKALEYHSKALIEFEQLKDKEGMAAIHTNIGITYADQGNLNKGHEHYLIALKLYLEVENQQDLPNLFINLGTLSIKKNDYSEALKYSMQGLTMSKEIGAKDFIMQAYDAVATSYAGLNNFKEAYKYHILFKQMADTLQNEESGKSIAKMQTLFETEKKDKQITILNKEKEKQEAVSAAEHKRKNVIILSVIVGLILVIAFSLFLYNRFRITQKQKKIIELQKHKVDEANEELHQQNEEIAAQRDEIEHQKELTDEKQKEIIDSITYARRIQEAMLTSNNYIKEELKNYKAEHFILFKPKDIVSGDFYWFYNNNDCFYYATADSTGHGVPGGFMSMLGINFYNEIVIERGFTDPGEILNKLREEIVRALKTDEGYTKDGMDAIVCKIDFKNKTLEYSAANNSFYIMRNNEIIEQKSQKMPVGYMDDMKPFVTQKFQLEKEDVIYTFTDGYADQFGGQKGKKFKYKQFEELIFEIHKLPLQEQSAILDQRFMEWKGELEQVDDVCVIGVKI